MYHATETPVNVPWFKVFPRVIFNFNNAKSITSVLNFLLLSQNIMCSTETLYEASLQGEVYHWKGYPWKLQVEMHSVKFSYNIFTHSLTELNPS
jgi:hypothetical protein